MSRSDALETQLAPETVDRLQHSGLSWDILTQLGLTFTVVVTGCANNISKQVAAKPLHRYTYVLGLATAVAYVPVYGLSLLLLLWTGRVPRHQLDFVWGRTLKGFPRILLFVFSASSEAVGDVIGMICTPYVSGPVHSLLSNCTPIFIAGLSFFALRQRYSLPQLLSLAGVCLAVVVGVLPSFEVNSGQASSDAFFALVLGLSCIFNALAFVIKEYLFKQYNAWCLQHGISDAQGPHVFVVNTHLSLFQLPTTLLMVPLSQVLGQTNGKDVLSYLKEALTCVFSSNAQDCGTDSSHGEYAGICVLVYVVFNISWNVAILTSVKHSGSLATFIALKAMFPVSAVLFAYVDWPLLGQTPLHWLVWLSLCMLLPSIAAYQLASRRQAQRAAVHPSLATCCWPLRK